MINRRLFAGSALLGLAGCAKRAAVSAAPQSPAPKSWPIPKIYPIRADVERIFRISVCIRPFRAEGPRMDVERVGDQTVVHHYGHGGSGWSLSWGSGAVVTEKAMALGEREIAVVGCGAIGLTTATLLQQAGAKVTIYAKERAYEARSAWATGTWSPDSRIALADKVPEGFGDIWEKMARHSWRTYASYLGMEGAPVEFTDRYFLSDDQPVSRTAPQTSPPGPVVRFARFGQRLDDINPRWPELPAGGHPFPVARARRGSSLTFNIASYSRRLLTDFLQEGGRIERAEFHSPSELSRLPQKVIVNATGYGARALWKDESVIPVRGQIAWLIPQPEVNYGVFYRGVEMLGRRDGIVIQPGGDGPMFGYNDDNEQPDRAAAEAGVQVAYELFSRMKV